MMKAVVLHEADDMRVEQRPVPDPGSGEVLLKVNVTSICGTDVKVLHRKLLGQPDGPFIMGHEYAGTVAALGPGVDEFKVGDRVAVEVHKGCERCENCIKGWYTSCLNYGNLAKGHRAKGLTCDGGFAEYAVNHVNTLYKRMERIDELLGDGWRGSDRRLQIQLALRLRRLAVELHTAEPTT